MTAKRVSRLAPSPTGVLHLGNARTSLLNWLYVKKTGGTLLLWVEDIDGPRVKAGAEELCLEDLRWLGLNWDGEILRQPEHLDRYRAALDQLLAKGLAYPCICSRKEVEEAVSAPHGIHGDFVIWKRDTWPVYQLAVVVDGAEIGVNTEVRGDDLLASTPPQLRLYEALG